MDKNRNEVIKVPCNCFKSIKCGILGKTACSKLFYRVQGRRGISRYRAIFRWNVPNESAPRLKYKRIE